MKSAIKKTALLNAYCDRFHISIFIQKRDVETARPILANLFWQKADWKVHTETHTIFVYRVKTLIEDTNEFFKELKIVYKKLRKKAIIFKIEGYGLWEGMERQKA
jgi:hypothetical protein